MTSKKIASRFGMCSPRHLHPNSAAAVCEVRTILCHGFPQVTIGRLPGGNGCAAAGLSAGPGPSKKILRVQPDLPGSGFETLQKPPAIKAPLRPPWLPGAGLPLQGVREPRETVPQRPAPVSQIRYVGRDDPGAPRSAMEPRQKRRVLRQIPVNLRRGGVTGECPFRRFYVGYHPPVPVEISA